jgi:DNA-binding PucR family transcriptional regulator
MTRVFLLLTAHFNRPRGPPPMRYKTKTAKLRLLADRLRRINNQRAISLAQAQEVCVRLGEIIYFLDELAAIALKKRGSPMSPRIPALHPMSLDSVRWEHIQSVYEMCNRNVSETARRLNMHRRTLQRALAERRPPR